MDILNLRVDNSLPHHYLIGVAKIHPMTSGKIAGNLYLKYGPLYFHNKDIEKVQKAIILSRDKLFPTSINQETKIHKVQGLVHAISGMIISSEVNQVTIHHFSSSTKFDEKHFEILVKVANTSQREMELLNASRIKNNR